MGLLKSCKGTCSEEHQGMTKTVSFSIKIDLVHQGINCCFVIARACNFSLAQASISHLVVRIQHAVWKAAHADPDSFQHTIAGKLVHDERGLNVSWLLVIVWYKTTDKVGFTAVESGHELTKRDNGKQTETVLPPPPFFFFFPSSLGAVVGWPGGSLQRWTRSWQLEVDLNSSTTVSLTGSLFFSNQPV